MSTAFVAGADVFAVVDGVYGRNGTAEYRCEWWERERDLGNLVHAREGGYL